jgi:hypothetical protein
MQSGLSLGHPRTLLWADAAETTPLRSLKLSNWDVSASVVVELANTHTSMVELELAVSTSLYNLG